jgi:hypothetical protein
MKKIPPSAMYRPSQPPSWDPPDYISIPEHLKLQPIKHLRSSLVGSRATSGLRRLLDAAGVRVLGDLDGRRLSDFEEYRKAGGATLWALRSVILGAIKPGAELDMSTRPIPMRHWWPLEQTMVVGPAAFNLQPNDLPISPRLEAVLKDLCIDRLGDLHGRPVRDLLARRQAGPVTVAQLAALLGRAEAGEFTVCERVLASSAPADLLRQIDDLVSRLPERDQACLTMRFGAAGRGRISLSEIGEKQGLSGSAVGQRLIGAVRWMRREGSLKLRALLNHIDGLCVKRQVAFSPELVLSWKDPARPLRYSPPFYVEMMSQLREADITAEGSSSSAASIDPSVWSSAGGRCHGANPVAFPISLKGRPPFGRI